MTIKFRIVQVSPNGYLVQTKKLFGWRYKTHIIGMDMGEHPTKYPTEQECIDRVISDTKYKRTAINIIQYPNLKFL